MPFDYDNFNFEPTDEEKYGYLLNQIGIDYEDIDKIGIENVDGQTKVVKHEVEEEFDDDLQRRLAALKE